MGEHQLFSCLGGNLGNKSEIFTETSKLMEKEIGKILLISPIYTSPPWGFNSADEFWNQVILSETVLSPQEVLFKIREIENFFGRERHPGGYTSRKMDIDILFYDNLIIQTDDLTIPHPLIAFRRFVLEPLAQIAPLFIHPLTGKTIREMLTECSDPSSVTLLYPGIKKNNSHFEC